MIDRFKGQAPLTYAPTIDESMSQHSVIQAISRMQAVHWLSCVKLKELPMRSTSIFILLLLLISCGSSDRHFPIPASCEQIVLVRSSDWDTHQGTLETFEKFSHQTWKRIHGPFPVVVGKNGMGWGLGLHIKEDIDGPEKKEGDGKSPAGIYRLGFAFGYAPTPILKNLNIEYRPMTSAML